MPALAIVVYVLLAVVFLAIVGFAIVCWALIQSVNHQVAKMHQFTGQLLAVNRTTSLREYTDHQVQVERAKSTKNGLAEQGRLVTSAAEAAERQRQQEEAFYGVSQTTEGEIP